MVEKYPQTPQGGLLKTLDLEVPPGGFRGAKNGSF